MTQKITPCLWFENQAEEAAKFYVSVFKNGEILDSMRNADGSALTVKFQIQGQEFLGLNGGPEFNFTEAVSFIIDCESQEEVDHYWNALTANGGQESQCGWLKDKYGLSWQVTPRRLLDLLGHPDPATSGRVMQAMLQMQKIDIAKLEEAAAAG